MAKVPWHCKRQCWPRNAVDKPSSAADKALAVALASGRPLIGLGRRNCSSCAGHLGKERGWLQWQLPTW